jgi:hypothetical protein
MLRGFFLPALRVAENGDRLLDPAEFFGCGMEFGVSFIHPQQTGFASIAFHQKRDVCAKRAPILFSALLRRFGKILGD